MTDGAAAWLPPLVLLEAFGGDWNRYFAAVHGLYQADFGGIRPSFRGLRMGLKREPMVDGMEATFWHFVSEGQGEAERVPDLRRCERIGWPMAIMQAVDTDKVRTWLRILHISRAPSSRRIRRPHHPDLTLSLAR